MLVSCLLSHGVATKENPKLEFTDILLKKIMRAS